MSNLSSAMVFLLAFRLAISVVFLYQVFRCFLFSHTLFNISWCIVLVGILLRCLNLVLNVHPVKTIFDGSNFEIWSQEMSSFLKHCELWGYVCGDISTPVKEKGEDAFSYEKRLDEWNNKNHQILTWITGTCASSIECQFDHFQTAKDVWDFLSERYSTANQCRLCEKLRNLKQQKGQSLKDFLLDMNGIWDQLSMFELAFSSSEDAIKFAKYQEKLRVVMFLMVLHEDYDSVRASLLQTKSSCFQLKSIIGELFSEETRFGILKNQQTNSVVHSRVLTPAPTGQQSGQLSIESSFMPSTAVNDQVPRTLSSMSDPLAHDNQFAGPSSSFTCSAITGTTQPRRKEHQWCHPHPLEMVRCEGLYTCNGCKMEGMDRKYSCNVCNFNLHEECMLASPIIRFGRYNFRFFKEPPEGLRRLKDQEHSRSCDACGKDVEGFVYHCVENDMDFHPQCAKLQEEIKARDVKFSLRKEVTGKCLWCGNQWLKGTGKHARGWSYVSDKGLGFHVYCFMEIMKMAKQALQSKKSKGEEKGLMEQELRMKPTTNRTISKGRSRGKKAKLWLTVLLKSSLSIVISVLIGDPTTFLVSTLANIVTDSLNIG